MIALTAAGLALATAVASCADAEPLTLAGLGVAAFLLALQAANPAFSDDPTDLE